MSALMPVITDAGLAAIFNAEQTGVKAQVTQIALGNQSYTAHKTQTHLRQERDRINVSGGKRVNDHQIHISALADSDKEFWVKEVGFYLGDGTLFAVWSDDQPLAYKSKNVPLLLAFDLALSALPANSIEIITGTDNLNILIDAEFAVLATAQIDRMKTEVKYAIAEIENSKQRQSKQQAMQDLIKHTQAEMAAIYAHLAASDAQIQTNILKGVL